MQTFFSLENMSLTILLRSWYILDLVHYRMPTILVKLLQLNITTQSLNRLLVSHRMNNDIKIKLDSCFFMSQTIHTKEFRLQLIITTNLHGTVQGKSWLN